MKNKSDIYEIKEIFKVDSIKGQGTYKNNLVEERIYTDAKKVETIDIKYSDVYKYKVTGKNSFHRVDGMTTKKIKVTDYSYVIKYLIEKEYEKSNKEDFKTVIKGYDLFLNDKNDKQALASAKEVLKNVAKDPNLFGCDLIFSKDFRGIDNKASQQIKRK